MKENIERIIYRKLESEVNWYGKFYLAFLNWSHFRALLRVADENTGSLLMGTAVHIKDSEKKDIFNCRNVLGVDWDNESIDET